MTRKGILSLAPGRAGALAALFGWLAAYLQLSIANLLGFSPLFALWFGLGCGLAFALLGGLFGLLVGSVLRRGLAGTVVSALVPFGVAVYAQIKSWTLANEAGRGELLLGPTVQALALAVIGAFLGTAMVLATGRGTRSGLISAAVTLLIGGILSGDPAPAQVQADPDRLALDLRPTLEPSTTLVLAMDGLDWKGMDQLLAADGQRQSDEKRLPTFSALVESGSRADMETVRPSMPPHVWTTAATGRQWFEHGVRECYTWEALGASRPFSIDHTVAGPVLQSLVVPLPFLASSRLAVSAESRQRRAFWEVLGQAGLTTAVVGWPLTYPAPQADHTIIVSGMAFSKAVPANETAVFPESWVPKVQALREPERVEEFRAEAQAVLDGIAFPDEGARQRMLEELVAFQQRIATVEELLKEDAANTYVLYDRLIAAATHVGFDRRTQAGFQNSRLLSERFQTVVETVLRRFLSHIKFAEGRFQVFVISGSGRPASYLDSDEKPRSAAADLPGIILASGAHVARRADLGRVTLLDFVPTLMYAKGLPVAEDLGGRVLTPLFTRSFQDELPHRSIRTYEYPGWAEEREPMPYDPGLEHALLVELGCFLEPEPRLSSDS